MGLRKGISAAIGLTASCAVVPPAAGTPSGSPERGRYVAIVADCAACHTRKGARENAGGVVFRLPGGQIVSPNITPSRASGIGEWSEAQFIRAVRLGIRPDGSRLTPAMPYASYASMTDADMHDLYAYYRSGVPPVDTVPGARTAIPFPFNMPGVLAIWNWLTVAGRPFTANPAATSAVERGRYLVTGPGHCGTCHSPRTSLFATDQTRHLAGAEIDGWFAPNLTSDPISGLGRWSDAELAAYLTNGTANGKAQAAGPMAEVVEHSLSKMSDSDISAIIAYLRTVPAIRSPGQSRPSWAVATAMPAPWTAVEQPAPPNSSPARLATDSASGAALYNDTCASCHGTDGEGSADGVYPSLVRNGAVGAEVPNNLVMAILHGVQRIGRDGRPIVMPGYSMTDGPVGSRFTDAQVAAIANHVAWRFGGRHEKLSAADVAQMRQGGRVPFLLRHAAAIAGFVATSIAASLFLAARAIARATRSNQAIGESIG